MARQATRLWAQCPPPGVLISLAGAVGAAAAVTPDLSADSRGRSFEALCDPPYRPTGGNASRNLFALLKPQRSQSPPAWRWSNPSIASQDPIDAALVPPLKRSRDVRHTLTALPALPQLSLLFRREPGPCMPLHSHTSSSAKIRRCCVDSLNSPPKSGQTGEGSICPLCAICDLTRRSKQHRDSVTSSAVASSCVSLSAHIRPWVPHCISYFPLSREPQRLSHSLFVSGRFAMIYVVDAKFFESTARDADRCLESPPGAVRDGARVKSPEPVMRRLPRRKVK